MTKENEPTKKSIKQHLLSGGILYLFICNFIATFYLVMVKIPNTPAWATYPIAIGTLITAVVIWFKK